jgi:SAM-dependent methyltransferase
MSETKSPMGQYVLGHSEAEIERLKHQSQSFIGAFTQRCFQDAGIKAGMKVLDVGSGAGDVAMMLAEMVGPAGQVVGVDLNPAVIEVAQSRVQAVGHHNVTFKAGDIHEIELDNDFDAVAGRLIFFHLRTPVKALRKMLTHLKPDGLVVFQDYDLTPINSYPRSPLLQQTSNWIGEGFRRGGSDPQIGLKLPEIFVEAGLTQPVLRCEASISTSPDWAGYDQLVGVTRSLLPVIVKSGLATAEEIGIENLCQRLKAEVAGRGGVARGPDDISAWTRKAG